MGEFNIDVVKNSSDLAISKDIYLKILVKATKQTQSDIESLDTALAAKDFEKVQLISHRLKGDYDNMRISALSTIAKEMNDISKAHGEFFQLTQLFEKFKDVFQNLLEYSNSINNA